MLFDYEPLSCGVYFITNENIVTLFIISLIYLVAPHNSNSSIKWVNMAWTKSLHFGIGCILQIGITEHGVSLVSPISIDLLRPSDANMR